MASSPKIIFSSSDEEKEDELTELSKLPLSILGNKDEVFEETQNANLPSQRKNNVKDGAENELEIETQSQSILPKSQVWNSASSVSVTQLLNRIKIDQEKIIKSLKEGRDRSLLESRNIYKDVEQTLLKVNKVLSVEKKKMKELHFSQKQNDSHLYDGVSHMIRNAKKVLQQQKNLVKFLKIHKEIGKKLNIMEKKLPSKVLTIGVTGNKINTTAHPSMSATHNLKVVSPVLKQNSALLQRMDCSADSLETQKLIASLTGDQHKAKEQEQLIVSCTPSSLCSEIRYGTPQSTETTPSYETLTSDSQLFADVISDKNDVTLFQLVKYGAIKPGPNIMSINFKGKQLQCDICADGTLFFKGKKYVTLEDWIYSVGGTMVNRKTALRMVKYLGQPINTLPSNYKVASSQFLSSATEDEMNSSAMCKNDFKSSSESNISHTSVADCNIAPPSHVLLYSHDEFCEDLLPDKVWKSKGFGDIPIDDAFLTKVGFYDL